LSVVGVTSISAFAADALGGRPIVVMNAVYPGNAMPTARHRDATVRAPKVKKPTGKRKTAAVMV